MKTPTSRVEFWGEENHYYWIATETVNNSSASTKQHGPYRSMLEAMGHYQFWKCVNPWEHPVQPDLPVLSKQSEFVSQLFDKQQHDKEMEDGYLLKHGVDNGS